METTIERKESRKNGNKNIKCMVCSRFIRSDHMKRHTKTHKDILSLGEEEARQELRSRHEVQMQREEKRQKLEEIAQQEGIPANLCTDISTTSFMLDHKNLKEELLHDNQIYLDKIELGNQIATIIDEGTVREESLKNHHKEALELYRKQMPRIDIQSTQLRPWQQQLLRAKPSTRQVIWIWGSRGNEGKSWFQSYLETFYGYSRVVRLDLRNKTSNILYALSKRPLQTTDIFLFNDTRAGNSSDQNYTVLEQIKDGCAVSSKYNSTVLSFKVPNLVIVFSNVKPNTTNLSVDRWRIYSITKDGLRKCK